MGFLKTRPNAGDTVFALAKALSQGNSAAADELLENKIIKISDQSLYVIMVELAQAIAPRLKPENAETVEAALSPDHIPDNLKLAIQLLGQALLVNPSNPALKNVMADQFRSLKTSNQLWIASVEMIMIMGKLAQRLNLQFG